MSSDKQNIKPLNIAVLLICILLLMLGLTFFSKSDIIKSSNKSEDGFVFNRVTIKYPTITNFLGVTKDSVASEEQVKLVTTSVIPVEDSIFSDTIDDKPIPKKLNFKHIDTTLITRIRYPDSTGEFINDLKKRLSGKSCRIFHYGDSQIEGDRITAYLRNRLQGMYGGSGPGFIPIKQVYNQISAEVIPSENWERYALFDPRQKKFKHKKYGTYMSISRFTPHLDSLPEINVLDSIQLTKATITISKTKLSYNRFKTIKKIGLHYGNCIHPITINVFEDDILIQSDSLISDRKYHNYKINLSKSPKNLRIELEGKISADFYGLTLDGNNGVQIDNIAMRGASGTVFAKSKASNYKSMASTLSPEIVIMQYGGNTVPYLKDSTEVENYSKNILYQINWLKRRVNNLKVMFIGPTDMVTSVNGEMKTYPLLPYLNKKLQETCMNNDVAYWNMYEAMGGKGSMPIWVEEKLAANDYTHFTHKGTKIISELFFMALYLDLKEGQNEDF